MISSNNIRDDQSRPLLRPTDPDAPPRPPRSTHHDTVALSNMPEGRHVVVLSLGGITKGGERGHQLGRRHLSIFLTFYLCTRKRTPYAIHLLSKYQVVIRETETAPPTVTTFHEL